MSSHLGTRITSFALATVVTLSMLIGIDTLAQHQISDATPMSQTSASAQAAASAAAPRS